MKRFTFILMFMVVIGFTYGQTLKMSYNFEKPIVKTEKSGYSHLIYNNCMNFGEEGNPSIPLYGADILLAQNSEIKSIKIIGKKYYDETADIKIKPAKRQFPLSKPDNDYKVIPNEIIYNSNNIYPENEIESVNTYFLAGHSIGSFTICPVEYTPSQNKVQFLKSIEIEITLKNTEKASNANRFLRTNSNVQHRINKIVDNPKMLKDYSYTKDFSEYDILLISNNTLLPEFQDYIDFKMSTGYIVATQTVEDIYSSYAGADNQEKIRNCVIDYYENYGITYVILGGDADPSSVIIPHRGFFADPGYSYDDDDIPADMYYCCLDGSWNDDGDSRWGEIGEEDLYAEVGIGRICVDNASEIENSTHKLYMYQNEPVTADIEKALMVGENLWPGIYGKMYKTQIETGGTFNGYTTTGISDNFSIEQLYEQDANWTKSQLYSQFNTTGINLLNHLGHCNVTYCMTLNNPDINTTNFQNNGVTRGYGIVYSQGCYCGSFDNRSSSGSHGSTDCFSEDMSGFVNGTSAMITNSRYGWGDDTGTDGASQYFDRQFFDAVFGEDITKIGDANADSKEDNAAYFSQQLIRWCAYQLTLFGDPTMDIWTATPTDMTVSYNSAVSIGTSEITFTTDAPFARVGLMQNDVLIGRAVADATGNAVVDLFDPISSAEDISVSIIAHNKNRHLGTITVFSDQPYVVYNSNALSGSPDYNQSIDLSVAMENVGSVSTTGVEVTLSVNDENITITDATETYGDFDAGQTIEITDAFAFDISDDVPDQHSVLFTLTATTGGYDWESTFPIVLNAPVPQVAFDGINDTEGDLVFTSTAVTAVDEGAAYNYDISVLANGGNGDGLLDPGETVSVTVNASNIGHANFHNVICTLSSTNQYVTINGDEYNNLETIEINQTKPAVFSITIDEDTPLGEVIDLTFTLTGGEYSEIINVNIPVGLIIEDFETGDFNSYDWTTSNWIITTDDVHEGTYSSKSDIYHQANTTAYIQIVLNGVTAGSEVSFWSKVSSEPDYDYLKFYIDGSVVDQWAGQVSWGEHTYDLSGGTHTLKWAYIKDEYVDNYSDCAWIDYITLPAFTSKSGSKSITITAPTLPSWLSFNDNGDGTADLYGTAPNESGSHDVVIQATGTGEPAYQEFEVKVGQVSIQTQEGIVNFYPNPTSSLLNITVPNVSDNSKVVISNITGKMLLSKKITNNSSSIDLSNFANGTYMLRLTLGNETITQKIIVK
ncbi:MAG: T9SS type A sorting domain-containing protein [Bacteroidales bacterium]|nr:T9SS type A sorting domain-containing protein [Bacteroidales bacterium]